MDLPQLHFCPIFTQDTKVLTRLGGQDVAVTVNNSFSQKYNNEFIRTLPSNHCAIPYRRRNIINLLKSVIYYVIVCFVKNFDILVGNQMIQNSLYTS